MISLSPFMMMNYMVLLSSTLMVMSSSNWIMLWMALELNLLSFMPILLSSNNNQETEASIKYMLAQALGSSLLLMAGILMYNSFFSSSMMSMILMLSLMIKIGLAPCHMWYPSVMTSISWTAAFILTSWQKLAPLSVTMFIMTKVSTQFMLMLAVLNALLGGMMGMNQTHLRTIMAYSSITHLGWMMSLITFSMSLLSMSYFIMYIMVISPIFYLLNKTNTKTTLQMNSGSNLQMSMSFILPLLLLSLGGLPPLLGFFPKLMTIFSIDNPTLIFLLILGSLMNLYYYLNLTFSSMMTSMKSSYLKFMNKPNSIILSSMLMFFLLPLMIM